MFCVKCGSKMNDDQKFCTECGNKVNASGGMDDVVNTVKEKTNNLTEKLSNDENIKNVTEKIKGNKKIVAIIAAVLLVVVVGTSIFVVSRSTPEKTMKKFAKAISSLDFEKAIEETNIMAMAQMEAGSEAAAITIVNKMTSEIMLESQREGLSIACKIVNFTPLIETKNMVTASVTMQMTITSKNDNETDIQTEEFKFIKMNGKWKLDLADDFF